ncbi:MAG: pilin [Cycloclasticus sp.]
MKNLQTMKHSVQKGFTLIELMIVVAIIGILAALAIPAYSDYTIKAKVSEAASLSGAARTSVDVYYSENGTLFSTSPGVGTLGISESNEYTSKYASTVAVRANGVISVGMKTLDTLGTASGTTVTYTPTKQGGNLSWAVGGSVPTKYRPKN